MTGVGGGSLDYFRQGDATPQDDNDGECVFLDCHQVESSTSLSFIDQHSAKGSPVPKTVGKRKTALDQPFSCGKKIALDKSLSYGSAETAVSPTHSDSGGESSGYFDESPGTAIGGWINTFQEFEGGERVKALTCLIDQCSISEIRHLRKTIEPYFQKDFIRCLPKELALNILSLLESIDLCRVAQTSRYWRTIAEDNLLWREKCEEADFLSRQLPSPPLRGVAGSPGGAGNPQPGSIRQRSQYKSLYLRHSKVIENWRRSSFLLERRGELRGHDEHVITCLQICGDKVVSGSDDNTLRVWSVSRGQCVHVLTGHTGGVWSSQLTTDGVYLASGSTDRTVKIWNTETGQCLHTLQGHTSTVRCMALQGTTLVTGSRDTTLRVWDVRSSRLLHVLTGHMAAVRCVQFDGVRVVSGAYDCFVKVWDVAGEQCLQTLTGHTNRVYSLQLDSERNLAISGSLDTSIRVWDMARGVCLHTLMGHQSLTSGMELRGNTLVSGNADSTVKVWDVAEGVCLHTLAGPHRHQSAVTSLQFLENGMVVTSSDDGTVKLWDSKQGTFVRDLVRLDSGGSGGCIWRLKATPTTLVCAVGSRHGTEDTKLIILDFNAEFP